MVRNSSSYSRETRITSAIIHSAITALNTAWWLILFPGLALGVTLFSLNFLGDGLRDALDPRLRNR